jgi:hypothetical protein
MKSTEQPQSRKAVLSQPRKEITMSTRKIASPSRYSSVPAISRRLLVAALVPAFALTGCYVMPIGNDPQGNPIYAYAPIPVPGSTVGPHGAVAPGAPVAIPSGGMPAVLQVRLYPANDLANQTGVLTGQVTNMMSGKGRFQFTYQGEMLVGEATRVSGEARKGVASAYGGRGTFARCEYQMSTPYMGAGTCTFSNGAEYQLHVGS